MLSAALFAVLCILIFESARGIYPIPPPAPLLSATPVGVNFGGWLCLEDWFFSGPAGRNVMSAHPEGQGACLPPLVAGLEQTWPSEGVLTKRLNDSLGAQAAADAFTAHRHSYIGESDLAGVAKLGIKKIRVPLNWAAFADALAPLDKDVYGSHDPETDTAIVPDPFYSDEAAFATVPRKWLADLLRRAAAHDLQILFDLHAFPGGSADGTYNGVWPSRPTFWNETVNQTLLGNNVSLPTPLTDVGYWVVLGLVRWLEGLDESLLKAVAGVTLMNEPAHMASFEKNQGKRWANESDILQWLGNAAQLFRASQLPRHGVRLYVNVIETAFDDFDATVGPWWLETFSEEERKRWAVMDRHWYGAWAGGTCDGRVSQGGGYLCDQPIETVRSLLRSCIRPWAEGFAAKFGGGDGLMSVTEFSVGTFQDARLACTDRDVLSVFLEEQVSAFQDSKIEGFFWTWRMPYGNVFQPGWSLKHLAGLEDALQVQPCLPPLVGP